MSDNQTSTHEGIVQVREDVTLDELRSVGVDLERAFPGSSAGDFGRYPVLSEGGWFIVIKHRRTLESVTRTPWRLLGPIHLVSENLILD